MDSVLTIIFIVVILVAIIVAYYIHKKSLVHSITVGDQNVTDPSQQNQSSINNVDAKHQHEQSSLQMQNPSHASFTRAPILKLHNNNNNNSASANVDDSILAKMPSLRSSIALELSSQSSCLREWNLMFSSALHGSSFPRLTTALTCSKGQTLIVIEEELSLPSPSTTTTTNTRSVFGGFTQTQWTCVKERDLHAKAAAASRMRAQRTGVEEKSPSSSPSLHASHDSSKKPTNQSPQFFGDAQCFIFTNNNNHQHHDDHQQDSSSFKIFQTRDTGSLANANYIYFFDTHSSSENVGLGMGGNGTKSAVGAEAGMAFFVDRSLVKGESSPGGCATFQYSTQLSTESKFRIRSIEVWCLNPDAIGVAEGLYMEYEDEPGGNTGSKKIKSSLHARGHSTAKAFMQMNGQKLWTEENDRQDA